MNIEEEVATPLEPSLGSILDVLAWEVELAGARCIFLDDIVGQMIKAIPEGERAPYIEGVHAVDLLSQQLTSLSAFTRRLSGTVSTEVCAPVGQALGDITLGALADRMTTALGGDERGVNDRDKAGDFDLF